MSYEISGKLIEKYAVQQITDTFKKREFVLEKAETVGDRAFVEQIKFQLTQDRCDLLEPIKLNDEIKVTFNIRGRKWEKAGNVNYFNNLEAWRIEAVSSGAGAQKAIPSEMDSVATEEDDLPF